MIGGDSFFVQLLTALAPLIVLLILMYLFILKPLQNNGGIGFLGSRGNSCNIKSKKVDVSFDDVAGIEEAKEELMEVVDFLKNREKYIAIGAKVPKGVLCTGPPGTGKTLIAKAVSGEADCRFLSVSASEFVEVFAGMGASRVRKIFEEARKTAPCIIFIDEIDAIGKKRSGLGEFSSHDEREQTLNQLLVEMDGFTGNEGVIIIAATNRLEVLDGALLRPGRFDRKVNLELPNVKDREAILKVHVKKLVVNDNLDLEAIAKSTPGASGADLANILNEAALLAVKNGFSSVSQEDCIASRDKVLYGKERRDIKIGVEHRNGVAYHEAGHAVVAYYMEHAPDLEKISIIPRGYSLGSTYLVPKDDKFVETKDEIEATLAIAMGGRVSEELFVGVICMGASDDIKRATLRARDYVCEYGLSEELGPINYSQMKGSSIFSGPSISEKIKEKIDQEIYNIILRAKTLAHDILKKHASKVKKLVEVLIEKEVLGFADVQKILESDDHAIDTDETK